MKINDQQFKRLPSHLQSLFRKLPNPASDEVLAAFPESSTTGKRSERSKSATVAGTSWGTGNHQSTEYTDSGSAARFFYCAKASKADRNAGCEHLPLQVAGGMSGRRDGSMGSTTYNNNTHPTVKPTDLMAYLCRLVTPPGGVVLDPFMGSGSTGKAAVREGFRFIGIEREPEYVEIARARISAVAPEALSVDDLI